ncbi:hypothetical protein [Sporosarcina pasteurii]|uniref:Cytochrome c oxidase subunit 2A n=1 Tax=Sporosarcina pasteurii TaxID=1474 RepID=A0A380C1I9_SPOPA|nr:hypothetical protein [Sporosarcina pasteurii]MDS9471599.1 hypothetical protein [Sporosarcina pasteurii]SUJ11256.1 Uncharacterised protein [Sporosarcina pasteurii]
MEKAQKNSNEKLSLEENERKSYKGTMFFLGVLLAVIVATYLVLMFTFNARI